MFKTFSIILLFLNPILLFSADHTCSFKVIINGDKTDLNVFSIFVTPSSDIKLQIVSDDKLSVQFEDKIISSATKEYIIKAPENKGLYKLMITNEPSDSMLINVFVKVPLAKMNGEFLNGYRIGKYPEKPLNDNPVYAKPKGLIEVTEANQFTKISPNFTLSDFVCKQEGKFPKYVLIRSRLLLKLEYIHGVLISKGISLTKFKFISAYRTPFYNKSIGNVKNSRHIYGGAADIYIDEDNNGRMDDLNKDGKLDQKDAEYLYKLIDEQHTKGEYKEYIGGLGKYKRTSAHPAFIHIDTRGFKARW